MKVSEMYPSRFMKAEDFEEGEVRVLTIRNVEMEELGTNEKKKETKPVVSFRDHAKELVLNKTNAAAVAKLYGDDSDDWIGKKIALHVMEVESFGDVVQAIRVKNKIPTAADAVNKISDDIFNEDGDEQAPPHWSETPEGATLLRRAKGLGYTSQAEVKTALNVTEWKQFDGTAEDALKVLVAYRTEHPAQVPQPA